MDPITIQNKGDRRMRLADHAVLVVGLDGDGNPVPLFGAGSIGTGDASAANQAAVQAAPGSNASKAVAVQFVTGGKPLISVLPTVTEVRSTVLEASHILKASAGSLIYLSAFSSAAGFILLMNSTTLPADGAVSLLYPPIPIAAGQLIVFQLPAPLVASTGIVACLSSTGSFTKTIAGATAAFYAQIY